MRFAFILALVCLFEGPSLAGGFYAENGLGLATMMNTKNFFDSKADVDPSPGLGVSLGLGWNLANSQWSLLQLHVGFKYAYMSGATTDGTNLIYQAIYPSIRIETPRFYVGGGITNMVYADQSASAFTPPATPANVSLAEFIEVGLLWRVVPFFHISLEGTAHFAQTGAGTSPKPAAMAGLQMRFYIVEEAAKSRGTPGDYDGWRYPFGIEIKR